MNKHIRFSWAGWFVAQMITTVCVIVQVYASGPPKHFWVLAYLIGWPILWGFITGSIFRWKP